VVRFPNYLALAQEAMMFNTVEEKGQNPLLAISLTKLNNVQENAINA
jgi:hypothetical protein